MIESGQEARGYSVFAAAVPERLIEGLLDNVVGLINEHARAVDPDVRFTAAHDPALVDFFNESSCCGSRRTATRRLSRGSTTRSGSAPG